MAKSPALEVIYIKYFIKQKKKEIAINNNISFTAINN